MEELEGVVRRLRVPLGAAVTRSVPADGRIVLLFSGGVDSVVLAQLLRPLARVELCTIGRRGAPDLEDGRSAAEALDLPWRGVPLSDPDLERAWDDWGPEVATAREPLRSVLFALGLAFERNAHATIAVGQGADELFGGYHHFEGLGPEAARARAEQDLAQLLDRDWPSTLRLARRWGIGLTAPYLDPGFSRGVLDLPPELGFPPGPRKLLLRSLARAEGIPEHLVDRPKRALQYGTRIARWVASRGAPPRPRPSGPDLPVDPRSGLAGERAAQARRIGDDGPASAGGEER